MFSDKIIKNLKPQEKRYQITDGSGLVLYIHPQGKKVFYADFRLNGTKISKKLGEYPQLSLNEARDMILSLKSGKELTEQDITLQEAYEAWIKLKEQTVSKRTLRSLKIFYNLYLAPKLKHMLVKNINPKNVRNALIPLSESNKRATLKYTIGTLNQILTWCINAGYLEYNKCHSVYALYPRVQGKNNPTLPYAELNKFFNTITHAEKAKPNVNFVTLFIIATLLRKNEAFSLEFSWISEECITIPAEFMKKRKEFKVPITPLIQAILNKQKQLLNQRNVTTNLVWYTDKTTNHYPRQGLISYYLNSLGYKDTQTLHGFRAMGRTWMADNNVREDIAETCLAHVNRNAIIKTYQRSDFLKERKKVLEKWHSYIAKEFKKGTGIDIYKWIDSL